LCLPFYRIKRHLLQQQTSALRLIHLRSSLPRTPEAQVIGKQLLRSGTSVEAHYRESSRARSNAEFISKIEGGLQELEETLYWLELLVESQIMDEHRLNELIAEASELTGILISCVKKVKSALVLRFRRRCDFSKRGDECR